MDKKFEDQIAKMAFGELSEAEASEVRARAAANADAVQMLASYEALKGDLRRMKDVPPDQLSKERLQSAILAQGLKPKPVRRTYPWAWAASALAVGAMAVVMLSRPQASAQQQVAINEQPKLDSQAPVAESYDLTLNPDDRELVKQSVLGFSEQPVSAASEQPKDSAVEASKPAANDELAYVARPIVRTEKRLYKRATDRHNRYSSLASQGRNIESLSLAVQPPKKAPDTLVLIQSDTDDNTGASNAVEMHQTEDVIVSS